MTILVAVAFVVVILAAAGIAGWSVGGVLDERPRLIPADRRTDRLSWSQEIFGEASTRADELEHYYGPPWRADVVLGDVLASGLGFPIRLRPPDAPAGAPGIRTRSARFPAGAVVRWSADADRHRVWIEAPEAMTYAEARARDLTLPEAPPAGRWRVFVQRSRMIERQTAPVVVLDVESGAAWWCSSVTLPGPAWMTYDGAGYDWREQTVRVELHADALPSMTDPEPIDPEEP